MSILYSDLTIFHFARRTHDGKIARKVSLRMMIAQWPAPLTPYYICFGAIVHVELKRKKSRDCDHRVRTTVVRYAITYIIYYIHIDILYQDTINILHYHDTTFMVYLVCILKVMFHALRVSSVHTK